MQAMLAIVQSEDAEAALDRLKPLGLPSLQRLATSGGFLRQGKPRCGSPCRRGKPVR